jgi:hypothetical protein
MNEKGDSGILEEDRAKGRKLGKGNRTEAKARQEGSLIAVGKTSFDRRAYDREYYKRPEVRERRRLWQRIYRSQPKSREYHKQYLHRPEQIARRREYRMRPEVMERRRQQRRERYKRPEIKEQQRAYERKYSSSLLRRAWRHKVTVATLLKLIDIQGNRCAICRDQFTGYGFCVDHCHSAGHVRGLLCNGCNSAIGMLENSARNALSAAEYLAREVIFNGE